jgi:hypothetical protein
MVKKEDGFEFKLLLIILFKGTFRLHGQEALLMAVLFLTLSENAGDNN